MHISSPPPLTTQPTSPISRPWSGLSFSPADCCFIPNIDGATSLPPRRFFGDFRRFCNGVKCFWRRGRIWPPTTISEARKCLQQQFGRWGCQQPSTGSIRCRPTISPIARPSYRPHPIALIRNAFCLGYEGAYHMASHINLFCKYDEDVRGRIWGGLKTWELSAKAMNLLKAAIVHLPSNYVGTFENCRQTRRYDIYKLATMM